MLDHLRDQALLEGMLSKYGARVSIVRSDGTRADPEEIKAEVKGLLDKLGKVTQQRDEWRERAQLAEGQLRKMGVRILREQAARNIALGEARDRWVEKQQGDKDYVQDVIYTVKRFVGHFGEGTLLTELQGREEDLAAWLGGLRRADGKPLGAGRRREVRRAVLRFLTESGLDLERKRVPRPSQTDVRNDRGPIRWLSRKQAETLARSLPQPYRDLFLVQVGLGLRPDELITLKRADFSDGLESVTLSPLGPLTLKEGSRVIKLPESVRGILRRRLRSGDVIFPAANGRPYNDARVFDRHFRAALTTAAKAARIPIKVDCRTGRRTCATLLLAAGVPVVALGKILGDDPSTVLEHYGAVLPESQDPSPAALNISRRPLEDPGRGRPWSPRAASRRAALRAGSARDPGASPSRRRAAPSRPDGG
jgi:integrase